MSSNEALAQETSTRLSTQFHVCVPGGSLQTLDSESRWVLIHGILQAYDSSWKLPDWPVIIGGQKSNESLLPWTANTMGKAGPPKNDDWLSRKKDMAEIKRWITLLNVGHLLPKKFEFEDDMKFVHFVGTLMDKIAATLGTTKLMANVRFIVKKQARSNALQICGKPDRDHLNRISTNSVAKSEDESTDPTEKENIVPVVAKSATSEDEDNIIPSGIQLPRTPMVRSTSFQSELSEEEEAPLALEEESLNEKTNDRSNEKESPKNLIPTGREVPGTPYVNPYRPIQDKDLGSSDEKEEEEKKPTRVLDQTFDANIDGPTRDSENGSGSQDEEMLAPPGAQMLDQTFDVVEGKPKLATKEDSKTAGSKDAKTTKSRKKPLKGQEKKAVVIPQMKTPLIDTKEDHVDSPFFKHDANPSFEPVVETKSEKIPNEEVKSVVSNSDLKDSEPETKAKKGRKAKPKDEKQALEEDEPVDAGDEVAKTVPKAKRKTNIDTVSAQEAAGRMLELASRKRDPKPSSATTTEKPQQEAKGQRKAKATSEAKSAKIGQELDEGEEEIEPSKVEGAKKGRKPRATKAVEDETVEKGNKPVKAKGKSAPKKDVSEEIEEEEAAHVEPEKVKKGRKPKIAEDESTTQSESEAKPAPKARKNAKTKTKPVPEPEEPESTKAIEPKKRASKRGQKVVEVEEQLPEEVKTKKKAKANKAPITVIESMDEEVPTEEEVEEPAPPKKGRNPRSKAKAQEKSAPVTEKQTSKASEDKTSEEPAPGDKPLPKTEKGRKSRAKKAQNEQSNKILTTETEEAMETDLEKHEENQKQPKGRKGRVAEDPVEISHQPEEKVTKGRKAKALPTKSANNEPIEKPKRGSKKTESKEQVEIVSNPADTQGEDKEVSTKEKPGAKRVTKAKIAKDLETADKEIKSKEPPKKTAKKRRASSLNTTETREHLKLALLKAKEAEDALNNVDSSPSKVKIARKKGASKKQTQDKSELSKSDAVSGQAINKEESREQKLELLDGLFDRKKQKGTNKSNDKDINIEAPKAKLANKKKLAKSTNPDNTVQESLDEMAVPSSASMNVSDGICSTSKPEKGPSPPKKAKKSDQKAELPPPTKATRKYSKKK